VNSNNYEDEITEKRYTLNKIKIYKLSQNADNQAEIVDNETVYFNDLALTTDNKTLRITDILDEYKRDIVISQWGILMWKVQNKINNKGVTLIELLVGFSHFLYSYCFFGLYNHCNN